MPTEFLVLIIALICNFGLLLQCSRRITAIEKDQELAARALTQYLRKVGEL